MNCPNCNGRITCGCQRRTASDKAQVCSNCITAYEKMLISNSKLQKPKDPPKP